MNLFELAGEDAPATMAPAPEAAHVPAPAPVSPRQGAYAILADNPLGFVPDPAARLEAGRLADAAYPGMGNEALALAAYYAGLRKTTLGEAFADLPALMEYHGDGADVKAAYERYRGQLSGQGEERRGLGGALEAGLHGAGQLIGNTALLVPHAMVNALIKLSENDPDGYGGRAPEALYRLSDRLAEWRDTLNRYHNSERSEIMSETVAPGWLTDSEGVGDWLRDFGLTLVSEAPRQAVQLMALCALGPLGGAAWIGAESGYSKYSQLRLERPEMSDGAMAENAFWTGLVNSGTAWMLGELFFGRDAASAVYRVGRAGLAAGASRLALSAAYEAGQEGIEQLGENAADVFTGARGDTSRWTWRDWLDNLADGIPENMLVGFAFGGMTEGATHYGEASRHQRQVNSAALLLEAAAREIRQSAQGAPTRAQAEVLGMIGRLADAASPDAQAAALAAYANYSRMEREARARADADRALSAPMEAEGREAAAPESEAPGAEPETESAPETEEPSRAEELSRLEEEANAAEAAHELLRRAPHDPMATAREVRRLASQVSGARVDFFATAEGLPETVRRKLAAMGEGTRLPRGAYDPSTGTVWVNAAAVSPDELPRLLLHEATAHAGLRKVLGDGLDRVLDAVWEAHAAEPEMLRIVERYFPDAEWSGAAGPDGGTVRSPRLSEAQRREAAEEFVARYADGRVNSQYRGVEPAWWTELKQRVRMLLARLGWARDVAMDDREIETLLARAHRALGSPEWAARREAGARFSLSGLPDGTLFVEVDTDQDIFDGVDVADYPKIARKEILKRFSGRVIGAAPDDAFVNVRSADEYAYPADHRMNPEVKAAKMRAATELDNLMRAGRPVEEAVADDGRHEEVKDWKYYDVTFRVGEQFFDGKINIKRNAKGRLFYDVTDIKKTAGGPATQYGVDAPARRYRPGSEPNLAPNSEIASRSGKIPGNSGEAASGARMDLEEDRIYLQAVRDGDMETAERMVREREAAMGYSADDSWRMGHRAPNSRNGAVSLANLGDSGMVPADYWSHPEWYTSSPEEREAFNAVRHALDLAAKSSHPELVGLKVYRAVDKTKNRLEGSFRNGDWVTPSKSYAENEGLGNPDGSRIIARHVPLKDLWWNGDSIAELGYDDGNDYSYKDTANNRKLRDVVTYDDEGNVIPLSKRFNRREYDVRFDLESYSRSDGDLAVSALKPYLYETEMADAESCLEYLKSRGFREFDLRDAEELMARASSELLAGEAEAARESLEALREANADPLADGGRRAEALVAGMVRARKTADEIRRELSKLGVALPPERLEAAMARAREAGSPAARRAFRERRNRWLMETDPLYAAMVDRGFDPARIYIRPGQRYLGEEFKGGFIDPAWRRVKAGRKLDERTRARLLSSQGDRYRMSQPLDVIARAVLDEDPSLASDELAMEELILSRFDGLTEAALDEEYRDARRREAAQERQFAEDSEAEWRKGLAEAALRRIDARKPFDADFVRDEPELAQEVYSLLTGEARDVSGLSEREVAAVDAAIRAGVEDVGAFVRGYASGQKELPQAVAEARKGDRAAAADRLRQAVERLEKQNKEMRARARTEEAELRRRLREAAEADRVDVAELTGAARAFLRENLPGEAGERFLDRILALAGMETARSKAHPEGRRAEEFRRLMAEMDQAADQARRDADRARMLELASRYRSRRNWKGVPVSMVPSVQARLDRIAEALRMPHEAALAALMHRQGLYMRLEESGEAAVSDGQRSWTAEELLEDMGIVQEYGLLRTGTAGLAAKALSDLRSLVETGRTELAAKVAERLARRRQAGARLKAELSGTRGVRGKASAEYDGRSLDSEWLLNHLTTKSCFSFLGGPGGMTEGFDATEAGRLYGMVEKASWGELARLRKGNGRFNAAVADVAGASTMAERKAWWRMVRTVVEHTGIFKDFYASEYGSREDGTAYFRDGVRRGRRVAVDAEAARAALAEFDRTGAATVATADGGSARLDGTAAGFLRRELADFDAKLPVDATFSEDADEDARIRDELEQLRKEGKVRVLLPARGEVPRRAEVALSQGQALQAWLTWRQEDCRAAMRWNGWSDESIRQLEAFLDPRVKAMGEWMVAEFRAGRAELDRAAFERFGAHLPANDDYFPTRYAGSTRAGLGAPGGRAATLTPGFLAARRFHTLPIDTTQDAFRVFAGAMRDQAHFLEWGAALDEINGVLGQPDVQEAIANRYSQRFLDKLRDRIQVLRGASDGGERLDAWLGAATHMFAASKLGFNYVSIAKQFLGTFAYLNDCTPGELARALGTVFLNLGDRDLYRRFARAALDSDYLASRLEGGMDRDLRYVLSSMTAEGTAGEYHPFAERVVGWMYAGAQHADRLSTLTGGYAAFLHAYEAALREGETDGEAFARGMRRWMRSTDETQQSAYAKDQNSYQNSKGALYRALTLFMSNPIQVSNRELVALRECWERGGREWGGFWRTLASAEGRNARAALLANHLVVPTVMLLAAHVLKYGLLDAWDEDDAEDYVADALMGSWDSVAISGGLAENGLRALVRALRGDGKSAAFAAFGRGGSYAPGADALLDDLGRALRALDDPADAAAWADALEASLEAAGMAVPGVGAVPVAVSSAVHQGRRAARMLSDEEELKEERKARAREKARRTRERNKAKRQEE